MTTVVNLCWSDGVPLTDEMEDRLIARALQRLRQCLGESDCFVSLPFYEAVIVFTYSPERLQRFQALREKFWSPPLRPEAFHSYSWLKDVCKDAK